MELVSTADQVSSFVSSVWGSVYLTRLHSRAGNETIWETLLHSPDGVKIFTLVKADGSMYCVTRPPYDRKGNA